MSHPLEIDVKTHTAGLSFAATAAFAVAYALTTQLQQEDVPIASVRTILGLSDEAWAAVHAELLEDGAVWTHTDDTLTLICASAVLSRAMGAPGRPKASTWEALRREALRESDFTCIYCGSEDDLTVDHVVAVELGGSNHPVNLVAACKRCNSAKGAKTWYEWYPMLRARAG
jgi:hypothetical protein